MRRALLTLFFFSLLCQAAPVRGDERFDSLKQRAERIESLSGFLDRFIGSCQAVFERQACEQNVQSIRRRFEGKLLFATVGDRVAGLCQTQTLGEHYRILLTPFVDGGGYALTHGSPVRQDAEGRPLIPYLVLQGSMPPGNDQSFASSFRTGNVELEVVFRPEGTWKLRRKGAGFYEGVKARFVGLRLVDARTGTEIASRVFGQ